MAEAASSLQKPVEDSEPEETSSPKHEETSSKPEETSSKPEETSSPKPEEKSSPKPEETSSLKPEEASSPKSEKTSSAKPEETSSSKPKETSSLEPVRVATPELEVEGKSRDINILLLGCTGVGKSTFINSIANYLSYTDFETVLQRNLIAVIPSKIRVTDKNGKAQQLRVGKEDQNEYIKTGEAQTQFVKTYVFPIADKNVNLRFIDTPGMGDPRGIQQDDINCENILSYIGDHHQLHAICFLLKPNESRDTVFFKYCMSQIFSRLDKSACNNIIFCFTNTRGSDYDPGETIDILKKNIDEIKSKPPHASIPCKRNIFCFDNECFRYLAALKENIDLHEDLEDRNIESWGRSVAECWKLYHYIMGDDDYPPLEPHNVRSTKAVNEARRTINRLAKPLADVAQLIQDNIYLLERHKENLSADENSLIEMRNQLYIPVASLEVYQLQRPTTVCTTRKCADVTQIGGKNAWHYKQRCHEPCGLGGSVSKEIIGDPNLIGCAAIDGSTGLCRKCGCDFKVHMHVYYLTQQVMKQEIDPNIETNITTKKQLVHSQKLFMEKLEIRQKELEKEHRVIIESSAKFAHFLQNNAITPFSDAYKEYIEYLITREKSLGQLCNADTVKALQKLLLEYAQMKESFDAALKHAKSKGNPDIVNPQDIRSCLENLYKLKHNGSKIKELYEVQEAQIIKHHKTQEYIHTIKTVVAKFAGWFNFSKKKNHRNIYENEFESFPNDPNYYRNVPYPPYYYWPPPYYQPQHYQPPPPPPEHRGVVKQHSFHSRAGPSSNDQNYERKTQDLSRTAPNQNGKNKSVTANNYPNPSQNNSRYLNSSNFYFGNPNPPQLPSGVPDFYPPLPFPPPLYPPSPYPSSLYPPSPYSPSPHPPSQYPTSSYSLSREAYFDRESCYDNQEQNYYNDKKRNVGRSLQSNDGRNFPNRYPPNTYSYFEHPVAAFGPERDSDDQTGSNFSSKNRKTTPRWPTNLRHPNTYYNGDQFDSDDDNEEEETASRRQTNDINVSNGHQYNKYTKFAESSAFGQNPYNGNLNKNDSKGKKSIAASGRKFNNIQYDAKAHVRSEDDVGSRDFYINDSTDNNSHAGGLNRRTKGRQESPLSFRKDESLQSNDGRNFSNGYPPNPYSYSSNPYFKHPEAAFGPERDSDDHAGSNSSSKNRKTTPGWPTNLRHPKTYYNGAQFDSDDDNEEEETGSNGNKSNAASRRQTNDINFSNGHQYNKYTKFAESSAFGQTPYIGNLNKNESKGKKSNTASGRKFNNIQYEANVRSENDVGSQNFYKSDFTDNNSYAGGSNRRPKEREESPSSFKKNEGFKIEHTGAWKDEVEGSDCENKKANKKKSRNQKKKKQ